MASADEVDGPDGRGRRARRRPQRILRTRPGEGRGEEPRGGAAELGERLLVVVGPRRAEGRGEHHPGVGVDSDVVTRRGDLAEAVNAAQHAVKGFQGETLAEEHGDGVGGEVKGRFVVGGAFPGRRA